MEYVKDKLREFAEAVGNTLEEISDGGKLNRVLHDYKFVNRDGSIDERVKYLVRDVDRSRYTPHQGKRELARRQKRA